MARSSYATANGLLAASREAGLDAATFHQLPGARALRVFDDICGVFTREGRGCRSKHWLWNHLREPSCFASGQHDLDVLLALAPPATSVWLIVEDFDATGKTVPFWLFQTTLAGAVTTLKNHHLLEFYLVERSLAWLVGENHHDVLFASGEHAVSVLEAIDLR